MLRYAYESVAAAHLTYVVDGLARGFINVRRAQGTALMQRWEDEYHLFLVNKEKYFHGCGSGRV